MISLVLADKLGYDEAWLDEHFAEKWENVPSPDLLIAKALALTHRIRFGTGVTLFAVHEPVYLAHRLAMLDHLSRGRFNWGIGLGGIPTDMALMGLDPAEVRDRSVEALDVVLGLWQGNSTYSHEGKFFKIKAPKLNPVTERGLHMEPLQLPHSPIAVAATTPQSGSLKVAGERGWSWMSGSLLSSVFLPAHWDAVVEGVNSTGLTPNRRDWKIARDIFVGPTAEIARKRARATMGRNYNVHQRPSRAGTFHMQIVKHDPSLADDDIDVDYLI